VGRRGGDGRATTFDEPALTAQHEVFDVAHPRRLADTLPLGIEHADLRADVPARVEAEHRNVPPRRAPLA
jgi:hypothetical protein